MTIDIKTEVGKLIEQRKPYKGKPPIYERFNVLVSLLRDWRDSPAQRGQIARAINIVRRELSALGVAT